MRRWITSLGMLVGTLAAATASAAPTHAPELLRLVSMIDVSPSASALVEAGAGPDGAGLLAIARDATLPRYPRTRAAALLGHFPLAKGALAELVRDERVADREVRIQAVGAYAYLAGADSVRLLEPLLKDGDAHLMGAAARALHRVDTPDARSALTAHRARFSPVLKRQLARPPAPFKR